MAPLSRGLGLHWAGRLSGRSLLATGCRQLSSRSKLFTVAEEVEDALAAGKPVIALETTIYTHGFPYPENVALASHLESLIRVHGGVPATIGIVNGKAHVGMSPEKLIELISTVGSKDTWKISRRDLGFIGGLGLRGRKLHGGTTIAGTMILAYLAGIKIFATGGLGGVHRGAENSMDISADLTELGRTPVAVISSGCKSFLDIPRTLEYLETQGVGVGTFADGRTGTVDFPAFFSRDSGVRSPQTIESEADAAAVVHAQFQLPVHSGLLLANPVPVEAAMARKDIDSIIEQAVAEAEDKNISGSANTPYILKRIRELSNGASVTANRALIEANVIRGTKVAVELARLESQEKEEVLHGYKRQAVLEPVTTPTSTLSDTVQHGGLIQKTVDLPKETSLLVAGSLACDTICDYSPFDSNGIESSPALHTSNPARISQSAGGVGRNVATAAHFAGADVALVSVVADDIAGYSLVEQVKRTGLDASHIRQLKTADGARTAQYVATNDIKKDLVVAMADMSILTRPELEDTGYWNSVLDTTKPKWVVTDGNWSPEITSTIISTAKEKKISVAFEPVSTAKAARLFDRTNRAIDTNAVVPSHKISLTTPNLFELNAMHRASQDAGLLESENWWQAINSFGLSSAGSRDKFTMMTSSKLTDQGVPQQSIQLLPYIPNIIVKLGSQGALLTSLLRTGDERLTNPESAPYILSRNDSDKGVIGGVYMRLFPPAEHVRQEDIVSVNGVGDTLLGVLMAGLVESPTARLEDIIPRAQQAAVLTLKSNEAVSPEIQMVNKR